jgi:hypothetical protein
MRTNMRIFRLSTRTLILLLVAGALAIVGVAKFAGASSASAERVGAGVLPAPSDQGSGADGNPTPEQTATLAKEKSEYDPTEVQFLIDQAAANHFVPTDQGLVGVLEFRNACREAVTAAAAAASVGPDQAGAAVHAIMDPEIVRLAQRTTSDSQSAAWFGDITNRIAAGEGDAVVKQLTERDCQGSTTKWAG